MEGFGGAKQDARIGQSPGQLTRLWQSRPGQRAGRPPSGPPIPALGAESSASYLLVGPQLDREFEFGRR